VPYFDLSFQHASATVLRRMRRFGSPQDFLELLGRIRARVPEAGVRSNVIVGFPGETLAELAELDDFLVEARLDVVGVFGYSDEDGTHAATLPDKVDPDEVADRTRRMSRLVEQLLAQRADERIGSVVDVLVDRRIDSGPDAEGRADHQGPEVDGTTLLRGCPAAPGSVVRARIVAAEGIDLVAEATGVVVAEAGAPLLASGVVS
jgi:ribosomal protein S12 methylthiotransferase